MTPMGYVGIVVIIGGGYISIKQLQSLYTKGCHTPAMYLIGSIGTVGIGLWILKSYGTARKKKIKVGESFEADSRVCSECLIYGYWDDNPVCPMCRMKKNA